MYYRISALNRLGGESEQTERPIRAVTKAEPLPPIELDADAKSLGQVELHWAPNVEPDGRYMTRTSCSPMYSLAERIVAYGVFDSFTPRSAGAPSSLTGGVA